MKRAALFPAIIASVAAAACVGAGWPGESKLPFVPVEQCAASGGTVRTVGGLAPAPVCIVPTPDADRPCTDSAQCTGRCLVHRGDTKARPGEPATGLCEASNVPFGCHAEVRRGRLTGFMCTD